VPGGEHEVITDDDADAVNAVRLLTPLGFDRNDRGRLDLVRRIAVVAAPSGTEDRAGHKRSV
jgi:hypothetical protein